MGLLADLGAACKSSQINITRMEAKSMDDNKARVILEVAIQHVGALQKLIRQIKRIPGVIQANRIYEG